MGFKVLGIDASGPGLAVGYLEDSRIQGDFFWARPRSAGKWLVPWISEMVQEFGRPHAVAVGIGPGSFTGVRIAVTAAKAYAYAWDIPVKGVSSLRAWASQVPRSSLVLVTSERRGQAFYGGFYEVAGDGGVIPLIPDFAANGELPKAFPEERALYVLGPLAEDPEWMERIGPQAVALEKPLLGSAVARMALADLILGISDSPMDLAPAYLRPPKVTVGTERRRTKER